MEKTINVVHKSFSGQKNITHSISTLRGLEVMPNMILVELLTDLKNEEKHGLKLVGNPNWKKHKHVDRFGRVTKLPDKLISARYNIEQYGMMWETDIQLKINDLVWFNHQAGYGGDLIKIDGRTYQFIRYDDCIVAKRDERVICLNGYVLLEPVKSVSKALSYEVEQEVYYAGKVAYMGLKNRSYAKNQYGFSKDTDDIDIKVGDVVVFKTAAPQLENEEHTRHFEDRELLFVQYRYIDGKLNKL